MTDLEVRLREDLPRLATALLTDATADSWAHAFDPGAAAPRPRTRRRRGRRIAVACCAVVVLIAAVAVLASRADGPQVQAPAGPAVPDEAPSGIPPGQYLYVRTSGFTAAGVTAQGYSFSVVTPFTQELWIGGDRSGRIRTTHQEDRRFLTPENEQAYRDAGVDRSNERRPSGTDEMVQRGRMDVFDLSELPPDMEGLRARLPTYAQQLVEQVTDWGFAPWPGAPMGVRQAIVAVVSSTPGVTTESRDGFTIVAAESGGARAELWFDDTGLLRRTRRVLTEASHLLHAPAGTVLSDVTLEAVSFVLSISDVGQSIVPAVG